MASPRARSVEVEDILAALIARGPSSAPEAAAVRLLDRFGTLSQVLRAAPSCQMRACDDQAAVEEIGRFRLLMGLVLRTEVVARPVLGSSQRLAEYLVFDMAGLRSESLRALYLDAKNRLLGDETVFSGTIDRTPMNPREIVRRALELNAAGIILVHNHPSGDPTPSASDVSGTQRVAAAAELFGIVVHDHLVVADGGVRSVMEALHGRETLR